jgi:hypothetical protein
MIRLDLKREPCPLDLGHGVVVTVAPLTSALLMAARHDPAVSAPPGDAPMATSDRTLALIKAVGRLGILAWEGVGDTEGNPIDPSPERIDALLDLYPIAESFERLYLGPALLLDAEKNGSPPSPSGTSAGAGATAKPAAPRARRARTG